MIIDFKNLEEVAKPNFKGGEKEFLVKTADDGKVKIMHGLLKPGSSIGYHKHEGNCEIIYVLSGHGHVLYDDGEEEVLAGQVHYCPMDHSHSLINNGPDDLEFLGIVPEHKL